MSIAKTVSLLCALLVCLSGCGSRLRDVPYGMGEMPANTQGQQTSPVSDYKIGLLDEINITVFREPDLSVEETVVNISGKVSLPLLGEINAFGLTTEQLSDEIRTRLNARFLKDAQVSVSVIKPTSYTFTIEGEVKKPGTYSIPGQVSLLQAVAIGEGVTDKAKLSEVVVFRTVDGQRYAARFDLRDIRSARADNPQLAAGDLVVINYSAAIQIYRDILTALPGAAGLFLAIQQSN